MGLLRRHKYVLILLAIYWPAIFIATHMPVPQLARESGMSDKTMHILAYMALAFLAWLTVSPYEKVDWFEVKVWVVLPILTLYGAMDEWLQGFVGRGPSLADFFVDVAGIFISIIILSIVTFWSAALTIGAIFIFTITNLAKIDLIQTVPYLNTAFHFIAYTCFTLIWIQHIDRHLPLRAFKLKWFMVAPALPMALLITVKLCSLAMDKQVWLIDNLTAVTGILAAIVVSYLTCRRSQPPSL